MPQVTVYIRQDDLETWKAIDKKSEFMHTILNDFKDVGPSSTAPRRNASETPAAIKKIKNSKPYGAGALDEARKAYGIISAAELDAPECPRHHVPRSQCINQH